MPDISESTWTKQFNSVYRTDLPLLIIISAHFEEDIPHSQWLQFIVMHTMLVREGSCDCIKAGQLAHGHLTYAAANSRGLVLLMDE